MKKPRYCYLAGPLTRGNTFRNIKTASDKFILLLRHGFYPFSPHLLSIADMSGDSEITYEMWMGHDFKWIDRCDCLVRWGGESPGADREVEYAKSHKIPVYTWNQFVRKWLVFE
jgi:nucleoside 2-deoxyribosyltransferase